MSSCLFSLAAYARCVAIALFAVGAQDSCGVLRWSARALRCCTQNLSLVSRAASLPSLLRRASSYSILLFPYLAVENFFRRILVSLSLHRERFLDFIAQGPCILAVENFFRRILASLSSHRERFLDFVVQGTCILVLCSSFCLRGFFFFFPTPLFLYAEFFLAYVICFHKSGRFSLQVS